MRKSKVEEEDLGILSSFIFLVVGALIAGLSLMANQQFPGTALSLASALSPTGAQVSVGGFRVKHWVPGFFLSVCAFMLFSLKPSLMKQIGLTLFGIGAVLMIDEKEDILRFVTTGAYP